MKTRKEYEAVNEKAVVLTENDLMQVSGGATLPDLLKAPRRRSCIDDKVIIMEDGMPGVRCVEPKPEAVEM